MKTRILITGINGFLATEFINLYHEKYNVYGLYRDNLSNVDQTKLIKLFHYKDIQFINLTFDFILHFASFIPYGKFNSPNFQLVESNIQFTIDLVKNFASSKIIYASSVAVYGESNSNMIYKNSAFNNPSLYGLSKIAGESIIRNCKKFAIIRFSSLYGLGMNKQSFIPKIIKQALDHKMISIFGDGSRFQDYFNVGDAARFCKFIMDIDRNNDVYLGVNGLSYSNLEVANIIKSLINEVEIRLEGVDSSSSYFYNNCNNSFKSNILLESGLEKLIKEYEKV